MQLNSPVAYLRDFAFVAFVAFVALLLLRNCVLLLLVFLLPALFPDTRLPLAFLVDFAGLTRFSVCDRP